MLALALVAVTAVADDAPAIEDNSFFIEEAYNQDPRVVQHIFTFLRPRHGEWTGSFTQEWPAGGQKNQLSYSLAFDRGGIDETDLHYRYQLLGGDDSRVACAPELTAILPSHGGDRGAGVLVPVSVIVTPRFYTHYNLGIAHAGDTQTTAGFSAIYAVLPKVHAMLETLAVREGSETTTIISPGVRWAYDFKSGLQIVPGIAVPITTHPRHERAVLLYLSFEHPF